MMRWLTVAVLATMPAMAGANAGTDGRAASAVEQRMQRVEDELAIRRMLVDYAGRLDARDYAGYAELFAPDGVWTKPGEEGHTGRTAIRAMLEVMGPAGAPNTENYHLVSNPMIDLDGDRATAISRFLFVMRGEGGQPTPALAGIYRDDLVRRDGRWMIARRVAEDIMPSTQEWQQMNAPQEPGQ